MGKKNSDDKQVYFKSTDLEDIRRSFRAIVDLRDRQYGFPPKTYESCFVGSEAVAQMTERRNAHIKQLAFQSTHE